MRAARKRDSVMGLTERMTELRDMQRGKNLGRAPTKTLLVGIAFAMAVCFISQAFVTPRMGLGKTDITYVAKSKLTHRYFLAPLCVARSHDGGRFRRCRTAPNNARQTELLQCAPN
jgi:hypothetical protein